MYPKAKVYSTAETEYSIEEIRACRYLPRSASRLNVSHIETEQAIQSILGDNGNSFDKHKVHHFSQGDGQFYREQPNIQNVYQQTGCEPNNVNLYQHEQQVVYHGDGYQQVVGGHYPQHVQHNSMQQSVEYMNSTQPHLHNPHQQHSQQNVMHQSVQYMNNTQHAHSSHQHSQHYENISQGYQENPFHHPQQQQQHNISHHSVIQHGVSIELLNTQTINKMLEILIKRKKIHFIFVQFLLCLNFTMHL